MDTHSAKTLARDPARRSELERHNQNGTPFVPILPEVEDFGRATATGPGPATGREIGWWKSEEAAIAPFSDFGLGAGPPAGQCDSEDEAVVVALAP